MSINIERLVLLEDMNSSLLLQKKLLGSSKLSCAQEYMKDCVTGGSAAGSAELLLLIFFFNLPIFVGFYSWQYPWSIYDQNSLHMITNSWKEPFSRDHSMAGMVDHKGKAEISFRNQRKKTWKRKLKGKGKGSLNMPYIGLLSSHFICTG